MKFKVSRTSTCSDEKPCDEAFRDKFVRVDERTTNTPTKILAYKGDLKRAKSEWFGEGRNHRVENDHIKRDFDEEAWFIEIQDLDALIKFCNKYGGGIVVQNCWANRDIMEIEIYDGYRE